MTDDPSAALAWLQETAGSHEQWWQKECARLLIEGLQQIEREIDQ